jgi:hypothetical protein
MRLIALLLFVMAGCSAPAAPMLQRGNQVTPAIPAELRVPCPVAPPGIDPPPPPRTFDAVVAWGQHAEQARADTFRALEACRARYSRLIEWIDAR